jgi:hypothetical protein
MSRLYGSLASTPRAAFSHDELTALRRRNRCASMRFHRLAKRYAQQANHKLAGFWHDQAEAAFKRAQHFADLQRLARS